MNQNKNKALHKATLLIGLLILFFVGLMFAPDRIAIAGILVVVAVVIVFFIVYSLANIFGLFRGFSKSLARGRSFEDIPTSAIRSAPQGWVELEGVANAADGAVLHSPLTGDACVWYHIRVTQGDYTLRDESSNAPFLVNDGTGECVVDPKGAEIEVRDKAMWSGQTPEPTSRPRKGSSVSTLTRYTYFEQLIRPGERLTVQGRFVSDDPFQVSLPDLIRETVSKWKRDPKIRERFDADANGTLDASEFSELRVQAIQHAGEAYGGRAEQPPINRLVADSQGGRPVVITSLQQKEFSKRTTVKAWARVLIGVPLIYYFFLRPILQMFHS
ncbi:MAG: GIDE domain-containing protein [Acidihalobacter sp.]|jgi:hypothetical protein